MSKNLKIIAANLGLHLYTRLTRNFPKPASFKMQESFERILIFSTTALGDFMFNTPAIRSIRENYPDAKITLISSHKNKDLVSGSFYFHDVIYWDHKVKDMISVIRKLRRTKPQLAIILHSKSPYDVIASIIAGCQYLFKDVYGNKPCGMEYWLSGVSRSSGGHLIQRKLDLVAQLGCKNSNPEMFIPINFPVREQASGKLVIGFQMGASETLRRWPVERFVKLAQQLLFYSPDIQIELIGSAAECAIEREFMSGLNAEQQRRVFSHLGQTTLPQLLGVIDNMQVLVTGDTGPLHLAIALKISTVSLFVTANPQHTGPYQNTDLHHVIHVPADKETLNDAECRQPLSIISVGMVFEKVISTLEHRKI